MTHRDIRKEDFVGKTVIDLDCEAVNIIRFKFEDGSALAIEVDAVGLGIYGMVACETCAVINETPPVTETQVDEAALQAAIRGWAHTPISRLNAFVEDGEDLYLKIVARAARLHYEKVVELHQARDRGIVDARRKVKHNVFRILMSDPTWILPIHDATVMVVHGDPVESSDADEKQGYED